MTFILLTGAGFSYNWGGLLASEMFSAVLKDEAIDQPTRDRLFTALGGFEEVLADLQLSTDPDDKKRHAALITAVAGILNGMNNDFMQVQFEFETPHFVQYSVASFLSRFHAIFTLNQDALLEQHYNPNLGQPHNWSRMESPGMRYMPGFQLTGARQDKFAVMQPNPPFGAFPSAGVQPYVKLHGAVNWVESNMGQRILIMGGQKAVSIGAFPLLTWYHEEFRKMLTRPSAKLMVVGYSFSDTHINDAIMGGLKAGLKLYLVDPSGVQVLKKDSRLVAAANSQVIGFSVRPLTATFGGDRVGHAQLMRFFDP